MAGSRSSIFFLRGASLRNGPPGSVLGKEALLFQCLPLREFDVLNQNDSVPPRPSGPTVCPVCREDLGFLQELHSHYLSCHAVRDNRLTTRPFFQCSHCSGVFGSAGGLRRHVCSSGDKLLEARQVGTVAATIGRPPPVHWVIATDGSASPSSVEAPASAGWAFVC